MLTFSLTSKQSDLDDLDKLLVGLQLVLSSDCLWFLPRLTNYFGKYNNVTTTHQSQNQYYPSVILISKERKGQLSEIWATHCTMCPGLMLNVV